MSSDEVDIDSQSESKLRPASGSEIGHSAISLEELVKLGEEQSTSPELKSTPRPSLVSTALIDDFSRTLYKINSQLSDMREMCDQLGGLKDSHDHRAKLNALTEVTKDMIIRANTDLRQLGRQDTLSVNLLESHCIKSKVQDLERTRLTRMTRDFQKLMRRFQDVQLISVEKSREFVVKAKVIAANHSPSLGEESRLPTEEKEEGQEESSPLIQAGGKQEEMLGLENEISYQQALIEEREQGIREIEEAMTEVHELFCDIGLIVTDQQGPLDNIESNIEASAARARGAVCELRTAQDYQRRHRGNYFCCALLFAMFIFLLAVAIINSIL